MVPALDGLRASWTAAVGSAALLAEGRTAAQVADQLVVSPNTVKTHVRNLYRKLGITRRDDLASRLGR